MQLFKVPKIPFMKYKLVALGVTLAVILAGMANIFLGKGLKLGVDFGEGTLIRVMYKSPIGVSEIRDQLQRVGLGASPVQPIGKEEREYQIRTIEPPGAAPSESLEGHAELGNKVVEALLGADGQAERARGLLDLNAVDLKVLAVLLEPAFPGKGEDSARRILDHRKAAGVYADFAELDGLGLETGVRAFLQEKTYLGKMTVLSRESVGPQVGKDLRKKAILAAVWSLLGMLVYIAFRFKVSNGVAAILTLTQDLLITLSIYSFTSREINLPIVAALLTIVGFSINDTIVIFDRIRENQKVLRRMPLEDLMNVSLNQMLGRTVITSGTVFLTILALFLFGGPVINDFAFAMLIGTIEGVYSTVFLACPVVLYWERWFGKQRPGLKK